MQADSRGTRNACGRSGRAWFLPPVLLLVSWARLVLLMHPCRPPRWRSASGTDRAELTGCLVDRMENAGDLIDTAELRAALSQRKAARDGLLSQTSGLGDEKSSRGRRRRPLDTEGASLK